MEEIYIYGASGHGKVLGDIVISGSEFKLGGFLDDNPGLVGKRVLGLSVQAAAAFLRSLRSGQRVFFLVGIGNNQRRREIVAELQKRSIQFGRVVHSAAHLGRDVEFGEGTVIMAGSIVNPGTRIGKQVIINTGAIVDHDCRIGDFAHISPGSALAGGVRVGRLAQIGIGASVLPGRVIGEGAVVGAGSAVISDVPDRSVFAGVPARALPGKENG